MTNFLISLLSLAALSAPQAETMEQLTARVFDTAVKQFTLMDARLAPDMMPRTLDADGACVDKDIKWWCSGFFPGSLWMVYEYTGDGAIKAIAEKNTLKLSGICERKTDHDIGFQVNSSYGNAYRQTKDPKWLPLIEKAAAKLATRFSPVTGVIKSWDNKKKWQYPVIIDNMMNLELLTFASRQFSCDSLLTIAKTHANTTMKNHFREDNSSFHLVSYDPADGKVLGKCTVQGYADDSAWSRGNAWGLYGYTMMFRETGDSLYLAQAEKIAEFLLENLPKDGIPYWDFNAPDIPNALRDASAGAIMASAFIELSNLTEDAVLCIACRAVAEKQLHSLASPQYLAAPGENGNFLLKHSVGSLPGNSEIDVPLTYADYYFLEALLRYSKIDD